MHRPQSRLFLDQSAWDFGSMPKIQFSDHLIFFTIDFDQPQGLVSYNTFISSLHDGLYVSLLLLLLFRRKQQQVVSSPPQFLRQPAGKPLVGLIHFSVSGIDSKIGKTKKKVNKVTKRNNQHSCTVDNKVGQANQRKQNKQHIKSRAGMVWLN